MRGGQFASAAETFNEELTKKSPFGALQEASKVGEGNKRLTPYETIPLTTDQLDSFVVRAKAMMDQEGITGAQFYYELPRALGKINAGEAPAPAELELLRYIATGVKESNTGFKVPDIADTDTLPMFGAGTGSVEEIPRRL